jgi:mannosyl-oligosaccharide alpha-1,2-mannosidase
MGFEDEFEEAVSKAVNISFAPQGVTGSEVNIFETIIRYLGGFVSAYDLAGCGDERLLTKAVEVADLAYDAFDTLNRMPIGRWRIKAYEEEQEPSRFASLAEMASFSLEFSRLSMLTGDMKYFDAAERVKQVLNEQQNLTMLPGLFPESVDLQEADVTRGTVFTFGANADSTYEYFAKTYQLLGGHGAIYRKLYEESMDVAFEKLIFKPKTHDSADILIAGDWHADYYGDGSLEARGQHLTSFAAGMFMLGGKLFGNKTHVEIGRKLAEGCAWVYQQMPSGIMAESFGMSACASKNGSCEYDPLKAVFTGFRDVRYLLRPEAIEAIFYAYRITGDPKYQDIAWSMFETIDNKTSTEYGNAELDDVTEAEPEKLDNMQSFWMAETLKYFYLIFSEPGVLSLDEWVFNTEAHPFRVPQGWRKRMSKFVELDVELDL